MRMGLKRVSMPTEKNRARISKKRKPALFTIFMQDISCQRMVRSHRRSPLLDRLSQARSNLVLGRTEPPESSRRCLMGPSQRFCRNTWAQGYQAPHELIALLLPRAQNDWSRQDKIRLLLSSQSSSTSSMFLGTSMHLASQLRELSGAFTSEILQTSRRSAQRKRQSMAVSKHFSSKRGQNRSQPSKSERLARACPTALKI